MSAIKIASTVVKKSGGSLVVTVPPAARDALGLAAESVLDVSIVGEKLILEPRKPQRTSRRPKYSLAELLAQCDPEAPAGEEEKAWLNAPPMGRELW